MSKEAPQASRHFHDKCELLLCRLLALQALIAKAILCQPHQIIISSALCSSNKFDFATHPCPGDNQQLDTMAVAGLVELLQQTSDFRSVQRTTAVVLTVCQTASAGPAIEAQ